ncbi:GNAT family N-acetyltransferase [Skermanella sp. TT6]|uniref:GNAT family N-acetyltransferase n=1 Tax=Skermanella cutis TaxID=2775420 RepID=A0ABX7AZP4_9PROT|nr:GNAT family N-acetyltransferase [Skermanella sp. TT6]QQP87471.1 GNAT family N-acetyltransferase [Skermanella sp. TT6]
MTEIRIAEAAGEDDLRAVRGLLLDYGRAMDFAICFTGYEREVAALPGLWMLAWQDGEPVGVVGLSAPAEAGGDCEMRRLYVRDDWRGTGLGRRLCEAALDEARRRGYTGMHLETLPSMAAALGLYRSLGFEPVPPGPAGASDGIIHLTKRL